MAQQQQQRHTVCFLLFCNLFKAFHSLQSGWCSFSFADRSKYDIVSKMISRSFICIVFKNVPCSPTWLPFFYLQLDGSIPWSPKRLAFGLSFTCILVKGFHNLQICCCSFTCRLHEILNNLSIGMEITNNSHFGDNGN